MSELRPCPWNCKRAIEITRMIGSERYSLLHRCPIVGPISFTEETAEACVAAWNHRPVEDALVERIARLEAAPGLTELTNDEWKEIHDASVDTIYRWPRIRQAINTVLSRRTSPAPAPPRGDLMSLVRYHNERANKAEDENAALKLAKEGRNG